MANSAHPETPIFYSHFLITSHYRSTSLCFREFACDMQTDGRITRVVTVSHSVRSLQGMRVTWKDAKLTAKTADDIFLNYL